MARRKTEQLKISLINHSTMWAENQISEHGLQLNWRYLKKFREIETLATKSHSEHKNDQHSQRKFLVRKIGDFSANRAGPALSRSFGASLVCRLQKFGICN